MGRSPSLSTRHIRAALTGRSPSRSKGSGSTSFPFLYPHSSRIHLVQNFDSPAEHVTFCRAQFCYSSGQPCVSPPPIREQHITPGRGQPHHTLPSILWIWPSDDEPALLETVDDPRHRGRLNLLRGGQLSHQLVTRVQQYRHRRKLIRVEVKRLVAQLAEPTGEPQHRWSKCTGQPRDRPQISACQVGAEATHVRYSHSAEHMFSNANKQG